MGRLVHRDRRLGRLRDVHPHRHHDHHRLYDGGRMGHLRGVREPEHLRCVVRVLTRERVRARYRRRRLERGLREPALVFVPLTYLPTFPMCSRLSSRSIAIQ